MSLREIRFKPNQPLVVAHRGASGVAPENTLASIRSALQANADMIELDVQLARDGAIVVIHDRFLGRIANRSGLVSGLTSAELGALDAGSWFSKRFRGEGIPTLEEALEVIGKRAYVNIEIKAHAVHPVLRRSIEPRLYGLIRECGIRDRVLFSSFHALALRRIKQLWRFAPTAIIQRPDRLSVPPSMLAREAGGAEVFGCATTELTAARERDAHGAGLRISVYTVNTRREYEAAILAGADAIVTNYPGRFTKRRIR